MFFGTLMFLFVVFPLNGIKVCGFQQRMAASGVKEELGHVQVVKVTIVRTWPKNADRHHFTRDISHFFHTGECLVFFLDTADRHKVPGGEFARRCSSGVFLYSSLPVHGGVWVECDLHDVIWAHFWGACFCYDTWSLDDEGDSLQPVAIWAFFLFLKGTGVVPFAANHRNQQHCNCVGGGGSVESNCAEEK